VSRVGRAAARAALRLYPHGWRRRYGDEIAVLMEESETSLADAVDVARAAMREHINGGSVMQFELAHRHPGRFAAAALLLVAPTLTVVGVSLLGHELGLSAVAVAFDPIVSWIDTVRPLDLALVAAPLVAFLLAMLPLIDLRIETDDGGSSLALRVRAVSANLAVAGVALLVGAALVAHIVAETVLEAGA
jgi:hypothetical protein